MHSTTEAPRPRGRQAHPGRLNRVGQSWRQATKAACICDKSSRFYRKEIKVDTDQHFSCPACGEVVVFDDHEYAFCGCQIWNDASAMRKSAKEPFRDFTKHFLKKIRA